MEDFLGRMTGANAGVGGGAVNVLLRKCVSAAAMFSVILSSSAVIVTNSFVIVEGEGVRVDDDGSICLDENASSQVTVTARPGWLVNGRSSMVVSSAKLNSAGLKMTSRLGEDNHHIHYYPSKDTDKHASIALTLRYL